MVAPPSISPINLRDVQTAHDLLCALGQIDSKVPERPKARPPESREIWVACRLLSTLAKGGKLGFPITIHHSDRPDVRIKMGNSLIGVEITEAASENFSEFCSAAEKHYPDALIDMGHFYKGSPRHRAKDLLSLPSPKSAGWLGDAPEREWAEYIQDAITKKLERLPGYEPCSRKWLVIYANLPLPSVRLNDAIAYLRPFLETCLSDQRGFDSYYIQNDQTLVEITREGVETFVLNDLWTKQPAGETNMHDDITLLDWL